MPTHIAVDVGGTQIRAACFLSESQTPIKLNKISTQAPGTTPLERLQTLVASVWPERDSVEAIGLAAPGPVNPFEGIIYTAPNIPSWDYLPLAKLLTDRFDVPVRLGNDANLAALAEWRYGVGQGHHHLIYITVSTGIGAGIIVDDRLLLGIRGIAAELGHTIIQPDGPVCGCGLRGHIEAMASGTGIARWVEGELAEGASSSLPAGQKLSAREIAAAAQQGDSLSQAAFTRAGTWLGYALANFLHTFNPTIIVIGGGVSRSGDLLMKPLRASLSASVMSPQYLEDLIITTASLGDEVVLMGALALARSHSLP